jgi:hypothetical protein
MSWLQVTNDIRHTESNAGILIPDIVALLIGKEHVGGKSTLRGIRIY